MPHENAQEEFLKGLEPEEKDNIMERPLVEIPNDAQAVASTDDEDDKPNRRERRLQKKLQEERESSIALAARLEALTEAAKLRGETETTSFEKLAQRIYGNQTPEAAEATQLLIDALKEVKKTSTEEALERFQESQQTERDSVRKEEQNLDNMIEEIEEEYNVSMDDATQKSFFQLLARLSPKDSDGEVVEYADPYAVYEELKSRRQAPQNTRAKDVASRSMVRAGAPADNKLEDDSIRRFLKSQGWDV